MAEVTDVAVKEEKKEDKEYNTVYIDSLLPNIQPYYKKIF